jgi:hypothetical protein
MTDLLLNSANLSPSPPRCVGGIEGGLAEPFRGRSAEAVPCWLSSLVGSAPIFTSGHYIVGDRGEGRKANLPSYYIHIVREPSLICLNVYFAMYNIDENEKKNNISI